MRRLALIAAGLLCVFTLAATAFWTQQHGLFHSAHITQQKPVVDGIIMRIDRLNVMTYPENGYAVLQVYCSFLGTDPSGDYFLHASIHPLGEKPDTNPGNGQQFASGYNTADTFPKLWECRPPPPESTKYVVVGVRLDPKSHSSAQSEHYVEFTIPYRPTHIPRG